MPLEIFAEFVALPLADVRHLAVIEHPGQGGAFGGSFPILSSLGRQEMEERIVRG